MDTVSGTPLETAELDLEPGWNLVGAGAYLIPRNSLDISPLEIYQYSTRERRYKISDGLGPTKGYWLLMLEPAVYTITGGM